MGGHCSREVEVVGRAARLAWRADVLALATQNLAGAEPRYGDGHRDDARTLLSGAFDAGLIAASGLFDPDYYRSLNDDVVRAKLDPLQHYLQYGGREGRRPSPDFDSAIYLASHEDVRREGINPLVHYLKYGLLEDRRAGAPAILPMPIGQGSGPLERVGLFDLPAQGCYAAVLELQDRQAGLDTAAERAESALRRCKAELAAASSLAQAREAEVSGLRRALAETERKLDDAHASLQRSVARDNELAEAHRAGQEAEARAAELQRAREATELKFYVAQASLQRAVARNDELAEGHAAELSELRRSLAEMELKLDDAQAPRQRSVARDDEPAAVHRAGEPEVEVLRAELERRDAEARRHREDLAAAQAAVAAARADLDSARSEGAATGRELTLAARELVVNGREVRRLQDEERGHLQARAERDALRLQVALLERDALRGREQETALTTVRAEAAILADRARASQEALQALKAEMPTLVGIADEIRGGLAAQAAAMVPQVVEARDQLVGRLERLDRGLADMRRSIEKRSGGFLSSSDRLYLDLLEAALTGLLTEDENIPPQEEAAFDPARRMIGRASPKTALSRTGKAGMRSLRRLVETALDEGIEGDVLEAGVGRGGACIYMRGILAVHGIADRTVWVADSFTSLPKAGARDSADEGELHHTYHELAISLEEVQRNFERFGLHDDQVTFLPGRFKDTLPTAPIQRLAVLRIDGDTYGSTMETLKALYPKIAPGGFVIIEDHISDACRTAVDDYRVQEGINETICNVDGAAFHWRKKAE